MQNKTSLKVVARRVSAQVRFLACALALALFPGAGRARASADSFGSNVSLETELYAYVPCAGGTGEIVYLHGPMHFLFRTVLDDHGGYHSEYHFQPQGMVGTGLTSGRTYQAMGVTRGTINGLIGVEETYVNNFMMIGQGAGNNLRVHENFHVTVGSDGTVSAYLDHLTFQCR